MNLLLHLRRDWVERNYGHLVIPGPFSRAKGIISTPSDGLGSLIFMLGHFSEPRVLSITFFESTKPLFQ